MRKKIYKLFWYLCLDCLNKVNNLGAYPNQLRVPDKTGARSARELKTAIASETSGLE
jgi:hypothetical protein